MAKPGVLESDPGPGVMVKKAIELKRELQRLVKSILDDQARDTLCVLKELKLRKRSSLSLKLHNKRVTSCPDEFKCPLSKELMRVLSLWLLIRSSVICGSSFWSSNIVLRRELCAKGLLKIEW